MDNVAKEKKVKRTVEDHVWNVEPDRRGKGVKFGRKVNIYIILMVQEKPNKINVLHCWSPPTPHIIFYVILLEDAEIQWTHHLLQIIIIIL